MFSLQEQWRREHREPNEIMNPNSISHRLFVSALSQSGQLTAKRPEQRIEFRSVVKSNEAKQSQSASASAARKLSEWSWSGWQHTTI